MLNAPQTLRRYYSNAKRSSDAEKLLLRCFHVCTCFGLTLKQIGIRCVGTQKMLPEIWNRSVSPMVFFSIAMSWKSLLKLQLWSHRDVFGSIARGHAFSMHLATKVSMAIMSLLMHPYGSTTKCKENDITMAARSNRVVIMLPLWVDHKM